ncbi:MAG: PAS domain-containing protein, partial [Gammaproteobacteria bacterium]
MQATLAEARQLIDHAPCGYVSISKDLNIVNVNQTLLDWVGYERDEVLGKARLFDLIDPMRRATIEMRLQTLQDTGRTDPTEIEIRRKDGSHFYALISSTAVRNDEGDFLHSNTTVIDISDRKNAEQRTAAHARFLQAITDRIPIRL